MSTPRARDVIDHEYTKALAELGQSVFYQKNSNDAFAKRQAELIELATKLNVEGAHRRVLDEAERAEPAKLQVVPDQVPAAKAESPRDPPPPEAA